MPPRIALLTADPVSHNSGRDAAESIDEARRIAHADAGGAPSLFADAETGSEAAIYNELARRAIKDGADWLYFLPSGALADPGLFKTFESSSSRWPTADAFFGVSGSTPAPLEPFIDATPRWPLERWLGLARPDRSPRLDWYTLVHGEPMPHPDLCHFVKTSVFETLGGFAEIGDHASGFDYLLRLWAWHDCRWTAQRLHVRRRHPAAAPDAGKRHRAATRLRAWWRISGRAPAGRLPDQPAPADTARPPVHIVVCGFPYAGCRLTYDFLAAALPGFNGHGLAPAREVAFAGDADTLSCRPMDLFEAAELTDGLIDRPGGGRFVFVVVVRDPRALLTVRHPGAPEHYALSGDHELWVEDEQLDPALPGAAAYLRAIGALRETMADDVEMVRFEDLDHDPRAVLRRIGSRFGVEPHLDGIDSPCSVPWPRLERERIDRRDDQWHAARLREQFRDYPDLYGMLDEFGYVSAAT